MKQTRLTDQQKIDVVTRYQAGDSSVTLGKEYNISYTAILSLLKRRGIIIRNKKGK